MRMNLNRKRRLVSSLLGVLCCVVTQFALLEEAPAQNLVHDSDAAAPPPIKYIPREDQAQLTAARDPKARLRLSLTLVDARLTQAAQLSGENLFDQAAAELGIYMALLEDAAERLRTTVTGSKARDLYKRMELTLRAHEPRFAAIRRQTPSTYAINVKRAADHAKRTRTEALNAFFGDAVVSDTTNEIDKAPVDEQSGKSAPDTIAPIKQGGEP